MDKIIDSSKDNPLFGPRQPRSIDLPGLPQQEDNSDHTKQAKANQATPTPTLRPYSTSPSSQSSPSGKPLNETELNLLLDKIMRPIDRSALHKESKNYDPDNDVKVAQIHKMQDEALQAGNKFFGLINYKFSSQTNQDIQRSVLTRYMKYYLSSHRGQANRKVYEFLEAAPFIETIPEFIVKYQDEIHIAQDDIKTRADKRKVKMICGKKIRTRDLNLVKQTSWETSNRMNPDCRAPSNKYKHWYGVICKECYDLRDSYEETKLEESSFILDQAKYQAVEDRVVDDIVEFLIEKAKVNDLSWSWVDKVHFWGSDGLLIKTLVKERVEQEGDQALRRVLTNSFIDQVLERLPNNIKRVVDLLDEEAYTFIWLKDKEDKGDPYKKNPRVIREATAEIILKRLEEEWAKSDPYLAKVKVRGISL